MDSFTTLLLLGLVIALLMLLRWRNKPLNCPPGPKPLPLLGNLLTMDTRAPFKTFLKWSKTYGPVMTVHLGPKKAVVLVGYDTVKEALVDNAEDFVDRATIPFLYTVVKGYGFAISNGERWRQLRRFTLSTLRDFGMGRKRMEGWIQEESRHLLDTINNTNSAPFEPTFYLSRAVSNIICALVFSQRFNYEDVNFLHFLQIINAILKFLSSPWGQFYNVFPWLVERLPGKHLSIMKDVDELKGFCRGKIQQHENSLDPNNPRDFIDCFLVQLKQEKDNPSTEFHYENLVATVLNLFLAGTETTSTTIRYALMLLIKHPEIQTCMQKEIDTVIGQERSPSVEDRKSLPFTDAVIHEVQRYIDLVPLNVPHCATREITFRGYTIPKDTIIFPLLYSVLRDDKQWENPWTFDPKHFLDTNGNFKKNPAFMPFSAGKRSCVGESLARMELFIFLVSLLQRFTFTTPGGPESIDTTPEISGFANLPCRYELIATPR
ncbi:cytochrome P450 2C42 [Neoarius graeffei]|uniref:cytochrome P450 2C42 n=1 Tax=Neoarius graeffei TaxID=443677 RepID=UPI00298D2BAC|nr:cytochrome P450 2C42 [Neoarius graeffei]